ncbi:hypothetical protein SAMN04515624_10643 [Eubacterium maltosivorans]|mgnify:FL=1|uniref:Uncharacterized protein n=1 Tax=Eubacterium maltosivorans TaxID=2041044 RepID=A0A4P9C907_EUBML|nr:hypothetical protein [Eubacterium maltosivorans]QCT71165.1 hypothetical protein CPZ25_007440 [Eubacterium maltosivorans]WPK79500.1 hypothetical protein EUMA32_09070 [Eubacterium maltosivorans]SDP12576.1 hypothetical protein SAMN04515624_10643 [Eubacterium maltosivorans]
MSEWINDFNGIAIKFNDRLIQIKTDAALFDYLAQKGNGSLEIAEYVLKKYQELHQKELDIQRDSIAIEILAHVYSDRLGTLIMGLESKIPNKEKNPLLLLSEGYLKELRKHTEVIDIGERSIDSNRKIWDGFVPYKQLIFGILNHNA